MHPCLPGRRVHWFSGMAAEAIVNPRKVLQLDSDYSPNLRDLLIAKLRGQSSVARGVSDRCDSSHLVSLPLEGDPHSAQSRLP